MIATIMTMAVITPGLIEALRPGPHQIARPRPMLGGAVLGVIKLAFIKAQAAATDAAIQVIAQLRQRLYFLVQHRAKVRPNHRPDGGVFVWKIRWEGAAISGGYTVHVGDEDDYPAQNQRGKRGKLRYARWPQPRGVGGR